MKIEPIFENFIMEIHGGLYGMAVDQPERRPRYCRICVKAENISDAYEIAKDWCRVNFKDWNHIGHKPFVFKSYIAQTIVGLKHSLVTRAGERVTFTYKLAS